MCVIVLVFQYYRKGRNLALSRVYPELFDEDNSVSIPIDSSNIYTEGNIQRGSDICLYIVDVVL